MSKVSELISITILMCIITNPLFAQIIMYIPQGEVFDQLTGKGIIGATEMSVSNLNAGNPSVIAALKGINAGIAYQYNTPINNSGLFEMDLYRANYWPQSVGVSVSYKTFSLGAGSSQKYSLTRDYGTITSVMVADNEQGYIESEPFEAKTKETLLKNALIISHNLDRFLLENHHLNIGVSFNHFRYYYANIAVPEIIDNKRVNINENQFSAGFDYQYTTTNNSFINFGMFYEPELKFFKMEKSSLTQNFYKINIPQILNAGLSVNFQNIFQIRSDFSYLFWEALDENVYDFKNQLKASCTITKQFMQSLSISTGTCYTDRKFLEEKQYEGINIDFFATYIFLGGNLKYNNYNFDLVVADSHLFSDDNRKQTIVKMGFEYTFGKNNK